MTVYESDFETPAGRIVTYVTEAEAADEHWQVARALFEAAYPQANACYAWRAGRITTADEAE